MELELLKGRFSVCRVPDLSGTDLAGELCFTAKTDCEFSLVCREECVPETAIQSEPGWSCFRIAGRLDFGLVGVLAGITHVLAEAQISVFAVSTYLTDYVLIREVECKRAAGALEAAGYRLSDSCKETT